MKKLLLVLAIGVSIAACNNNASDKPAGGDSATAPATADTAKPAMTDTTKHDTTLAPVKADTTKK